MAGAPRRALALICEPLSEAMSNVSDRRVGIVAVIALSFAGDGGVQRVVEVVVPLRGVVAGAAISVAHQATRLVAIVLEHEMDRTLATAAFAHCRRQLGEDIRRRIVV